MMTVNPCQELIDGLCPKAWKKVWRIAPRLADILRWMLHSRTAPCTIRRDAKPSNDNTTS